IPSSARHFARTSARRIGKVIDTISAESMASLQRYDWPGNVRELEHLVERAVILSRGPELRVPLGGLGPPLSSASPSSPLSPRGGTLQDIERELIRRTLEECRWVIGGGAGPPPPPRGQKANPPPRVERVGL